MDIFLIIYTLHLFICIVLCIVINNELENFQLTVSSKQPYKKTLIDKIQGKWIKEGEIVTFNNQDLKGGFFYFGNELESLDRYFIESSLVNPDLTVNFSSPDNKGTFMGYWPNYSTICPESRAAYINWLKSDRSNPNTYISYIFLYFYGIERRLIVDSKIETFSDEEISSLCNELYRLKHIYGSNSSFNNHVLKLLSYCVTIFPDYFYNKFDIDLFLGSKKLTPAIKYTLADQVNKNSSIDENIAFLWVLSNPHYKLKAAVKRCSNEFETLFKIKFLLKYKEGFIIKPNKKRLTILYIPSSASLKKYPETLYNMPDISTLKLPLNKLSTLADNCIEELAGYSRFIGRGGDKNSLEALTYFPKELLSNIKNKEFDYFKSEIDNKIQYQDFKFSIPSLFNILFNETEKTFSNKDYSILERLISIAGYGIAPSNQFHNVKVDLTSFLILFKDGYTENFIPSQTYIGILNQLKICLYFMNAYFQVNEQVLSKIILLNEFLTSREKNYLSAYLTWNISSKEKIVNIKKMLEELSLKDAYVCSKILTNIAISDGIFLTENKILLEKIFLKLGLTSYDFNNEINSRNLFSLNHNLLKKYEKDTKEVQAILGTIFTNDIIEEPQPIQIIGLDKNHTTLYNILITKDTWSCDEVKQHCENLGLMENVAIEVINDWTYDLVDAPLIEMGDPYYIDFDILKELK